MGLTSLFSGRRNAPGAVSGSLNAGPDSVQQARTRARHRLIGSAVLVAVGLVIFPMIFETEPRPVSPDIPIEIARRDAARSSEPASGRSSERVARAPLPESPARRPELITETAAEAGREVVLTPPAAASRSAPVGPASAPKPAAAAAAKPAAAASATKPVPAKPAASVPVKTIVAAKPPAPTAAATAGKPAAPAASRPSAVPELRSATRSAAATAETPTAPVGDAARAQLLLEGKEVDDPGLEKAARTDKVDAPGTRFIIQVGAFADSATAQATRLKVERLGMKTYTHVAQTPGGERTRVRVGPVTSRAEAERLQARLKAAGIGAAVLTL